MEQVLTQVLTFSDTYHNHCFVVYHAADFKVNFVDLFGF